MGCVSGSTTIAPSAAVDTAAVIGAHLFCPKIKEEWRELAILIPKC